MSTCDPSALECVSVCPVCVQGYNERQRRPKLLGCGHTFCLHCLQEIAGGSGRGARDSGMLCPVCRQATGLPGPGVMHLPDNFAIIGFISGGSGGGAQVLRDTRQYEKMKFFCLSCHRLLCCYCALKHKSQAPHHTVDSAESAALLYREKIGFALDYCREKQTFLDKLVQDSTYEKRQLNGLSFSLERLVNNSSAVELLSQRRTLVSLEGCAQPCPRPPVLSGSQVPQAFWSFGSFQETANKIDRSGTFSSPAPDPDGPFSPLPTSVGELGEERGVLQPVGIAVSPDNVVLVTERNGHGVSTLDLNGNQRQAHKWTLEAEEGVCAGVAISSLGFLVVVAKPRSRCISAHTRGGRWLFSVRLGWRCPFGVAITRRSRVVVSDCCERGTLSMLTVDWTSGSILHVHRVKGLRRPSFLACSADDKIAISVTDSVHLYSTAGALIWKSGPDQGAFRPMGIAIDSESNIIVADHTSGNVVLLSQDGRLLRCVIQGLRAPQGLALSPDGILVIGDHGNNRVIAHPYLPAPLPPPPPSQ